MLGFSSLTATEQVKSKIGTCSIAAAVVMKENGDRCTQVPLSRHRY